MSDAFVTRDGTRVHVELSGPADAEVTLVLVHGWTQDLRTWDRVVAALPPSTRVLRYDLRGHGGSDPAMPGTPTIDQLADDVAELVTERVPQGTLVLAGHSMGGMTIMGLADRHPGLVAERVGAAAFVATSCGDMDRITLGLPGRLGTAAARAERIVGRRLLRYRRDTLPVPPGPAGRVGARLVFGKRPRRADLASVADQLRRAHPRSIGGFQSAIRVHDRRTALAALATVPTVVLAGDRDRLTPVRHAEAIAEQLPESRFVLYPGAGHMVPQERPGEVAAVLAELTSAATENPRRSRAMPAST